MADAPAARFALQILTLLSQQSAPLGAASIARALGIPRSTTYRILAVLLELGFIARIEEDHRYALGVAAFELGFAYSRQGPLHWLGASSLARLVEQTGHNGHFAVLHGSDVLYVVEERAPGRPSLITDVGVRLPAHLTASGLAMLATLATNQLAALYPERHTFVQRSDRGPRSLSDLRALLREVRERGYGIEDGLVTPGYASIACAVCDHAGHPVAALTLTFPSHALDDRARDALAGQIATAAAQLSHALGGGRD